MSIDTIKKQYIELKKLIEKYNYNYYEKNISLISDQEFDNMLKQLEEIEKNYPELKNIDSPTEKVGGFINQKFSKVKHSTSMLSLANTYNIDEIEEFNKRINKIIQVYPEYVLELKLDGISIELKYIEGKLVQALTRGDGVYGEDVTENVFKIKNIPKVLNEKVDIELRGEIILPISEFNRINQERELNGEDVFANTRNAAAGTIRQLDSNIVAQRNLKCYVYYIVNTNDFNLKTHMDSIKYIEHLGFETTKVFELYNNIKDLENAISKWDDKRKSLDYETDGLVLKLNDLTKYEILSNTAKAPRWAIAYKFKSEQAETKILSVDFQVGRTGVITPVANFKSINLSGSIVKRASLHNFDEIKRKDIRLYDYVIVQKAAEIIPQVVSVVTDKRNGKEQILSIPEYCPSCNEKTYSYEDIVAIKCINEYCPEKLCRNIEYFVSRECMNIKGLGEKIIRKLIELGFITNILDLYNLKNFRNEIIQLDKMGEKNTDNLLNSIEKSIKNPLSTVIFSLGIPYIGKTTASLICDEFNNIDNIINADVESLEKIKGIGTKAANSIYEFFKNKNNIRIINSLKEIGFILANNKIDYKENINISGKSFLVTGTLKNFTRNQIKDIILSYKATYLSSVSKNLDYLIVGEKAGSKLKKAQELNIKILSEEEFEKLITQGD